jgi:hypothetical protein
LKIQNLKTKDLKPYPNNPRQNDEAVKYVANSIREFGFKSPIIVDKNNTVICGHTRLKAAEKLGLDTVPVVVADDLTPQQVKAYRLADNKVSEAAQWDFELLEQELNGIDLNMSDFNFNYEIGENDDIDNFFDDEEEHEKDDYSHIHAINNMFNLETGHYEGDGEFDIPMMLKTDISDEEIESTDLISFNYCKSQKDFDFGVHFFLHDYQFERVWNNPKQYVQMLSRFKFVLSPDFSPYGSMPRVIRAFNVYRNRWCGRFWQENGIKVIPTVTWSSENTLDFCFDGVPQGSTIAVSTMGDGAGSPLLFGGWDLMIDKLQPKTILLYGDDLRDKLKFEGNFLYKKITSIAVKR